MFAAAAGVSFEHGRSNGVRRGQAAAGLDGAAFGAAARRPGAWRDTLLDFERSFAQPIWQALCAGKIAQLQIDVLAETAFGECC